jgi:hypothetical protein
MAPSGEWLDLVLQHHGQIEVALEKSGRVTRLDEYQIAHRELRVLLSAHTDAEELVLYAALGLVNKAQANAASAEHEVIRLHLAEIRLSEPFTVEHRHHHDSMEVYVLNHMYQEECLGLLALQVRTLGTTQSQLSKRYREEFTRHFALAAS